MKQESPYNCDFDKLCDIVSQKVLTGLIDRGTIGMKDGVSSSVSFCLAWARHNMQKEIKKQMKQKKRK